MSYARFIVLFIVLDIIEIDNSEILSEENQPLMFTGQWKLTSLTLILQTEVEPRGTAGPVRLPLGWVLTDSLEALHTSPLPSGGNRVLSFNNVRNEDVKWINDNDELWTMEKWLIVSLVYVDGADYHQFVILYNISYLPVEFHLCPKFVIGILKFTISFPKNR